MKLINVFDLWLFFRDRKLEDTYFDKDVEKAFMEYSKPIYEGKTKESLLIAKEVGNTYTSSVYCGLASFIARYISFSV